MSGLRLPILQKSLEKEKYLQWLSRPSIKRNGHQQLELVGMYLSQLKHLYSSSGLIH